MSRLMPSHGGFTQNHRPPHADLLALVERDVEHWYWLGDFARQDDFRYAVYRWAPHAEPPTNYVVARVLWTYANNRTLWRRALRNTCGLTTCVNPAHYTRVARRDEQAIAVTLPSDFVFPDGSRARLAQFRGTPNVHIVRDDSAYTACYLRVHDLVPAVPGSVITCPRCVHEWRDFGRPLLSLEDL